MYETHPMLEIAVLGDNAFEKAQAVQQRFIPNRVVAASTGPSDANPLLAHKPADPDAWIYLCRDYACQQPVRSLADLDQLILTSR